MELTLDLSTVAIAEHAHDGHLDFDQLGRLVFDWEDRPTWACGPTAMLDAVEKVWDDAGLRDGLHMEGSPSPVPTRAARVARSPFRFPTSASK